MSHANSCWCELRRIIREKCISLDRIKKVFASVDINGPLTSLSSAALVPYPGIVEHLHRVKQLGVELFINTGWDEHTVRLFDKKRLGGIIDGAVCERGNVFRYKKGKIKFTVGLDTRNLIADLLWDVLEACSDLDLSFADQGNLVNACFYHENERDLTRHMCRDARPRPTAEQFAGRLRKFGLNPKVSNGTVSLGKLHCDREILRNTLAEEFKLVTVRPRVRESDILFQIDGYEDRDLTITELEALSRSVVSRHNGKGKWEYRVNQDRSIDYALSKDVVGREVTKAVGLHALVAEALSFAGVSESDALILAIGDGLDDATIRKLPHTIFFGMTGTKAEPQSDLSVPDSSTFLSILERVLTEICTANQPLGQKDRVFSSNSVELEDSRP